MNFKEEMQMDNPRELALKSLIKTEVSGAFTNLEINTTLTRADLDEKDSALYTVLYLGVIENKIFLDYVIKKYSSIDIEKIDVTELNVLRLGIYQLYFLDKIPDYSATDECVKLCQKRTKGFVNAVLRAFIRDGKKVELPKEKWQGVSVMHSFPMSIIELLRASYGDDVAYELITNAAKENELCLRVNTLRTSTSELISELTKREINAIVSSYASDVIKCACPISKITDLLESGAVFVQDESSRICALALGAKENEKILDACACPGGKTFSISMDMQNKGEILACDLHENKLSLITKSARKLGINVISTKAQNAKEYVSEYESAFDRVLCDVPCSGIGIIFKKPDIKYKDISSINNLPCVQFDILSNCSKYVKVGGTLVYSTCTLNKAENEDNVTRFLEENDGFEFVDFEIGNVKSKNGMYTFLPHVTGTDGFFVAKMKRVK